MTQEFKHGYAVIIGVDENQLSGLALPAVAQDIQAFYNVLVHPERCGYPAGQVRLLHGEQSTQKNIFEALYWLQEQVQADPEATAVIYYSGHGMLDHAADQYYLIPYDIRSLQRVRADAIKAESFAAEIAALQPKRLLLILDCCHAAGVDAKALAPETPAPQLAPRAFPLEIPETKDIPVYDPAGKNLHQLAQGEGRAILNSSRGAESSYVRRDSKMSIFTYHLIEALTGHARPTTGATTVLVTDVMSHLDRRVAETAQAEGRRQRPVMRTSGVFPVALLLGGKGLSGGAPPPDPSDPLPPGGPSLTIHQEGQKVHGQQVIIGRAGNIGQIGDRIKVGDIKDSEGIAIGRGARSEVHKKGK